ncbi:hypothetical protein MJH12_12545 [bacterium]|nr:hypothetical protein [bacterium]
MSKFKDKSDKESKSARAKDKARIKELEKQLLRKDKALAEASALLILRNKAELLFQELEEEDKKSSKIQTKLVMSDRRR